MGRWLVTTAGFSDFAGSTLVHACGGAAALAGVIVLGAREGRFGIKVKKIDDTICSIKYSISNT